MTREMDCRGVIIVGGEVDDAEAKRLAALGFVVRRVESVESVKDMLASGDPAAAIASIRTAAGGGEVLVHAGADSPESDNILSSEEPSRDAGTGAVAGHGGSSSKITTSSGQPGSSSGDARHRNGAPQDIHRPRKLFWLPVALILVAMVILWPTRDYEAYGPLWLAPIFNALFATGVSLLVAVLAARSVLGGGRRLMALLGSGMLAYGAASAMGGVCASTGHMAQGIAIFNLGVCAAGAANLLAASAMLMRVDPVRRWSREMVLWIGYFVTASVLVVVAWAAFSGMLPPFFVPGQGPSIWRRIVLGVTIGEFGCSSAFLLAASRRSRSGFLGWYALGLGLITLGFVAVYAIRHIGSPLGWLGTLAMYMGMGYVLMAVIQSVRESGAWSIKLEAALYESEERFQTLFMSVTDGFYLAQVIYNDSGTPCDYTYLEVNPAFERIIRLSRDQIIGKRYRELLPSDPDPGWMDVFRNVVQTGHPTTYQFHSEAYGRHFRTVAFRPAEGQFAVLVTDITEHEQAEQELYKLNRTLKAHSNSGHAMMRAEDESEYLEEVCRIVVEDCGHAMVWIGYAEDDEAKSVRPVAYSGFDEGYLETLNLTWSDTERGRGPTGIAIRTGSPSMCKDMLTDPKFEPWREQAIKRGYASSIALPLKANDKVFGAITIYSREPDPFAENEVALLSELAGDLAHGITTLRLRAERKRVEEEITRVKYSQQLLLDHFPGVVLLLRTPTREVVATNQAGIDVGAVCGSKCFETWGQSPSPCPWCLAQELWATGAEQHVVLEADGKVFEAHWVPVADDLYMHYALDITEHKRTEERLQDKDQLVQQALSISNAFTFDWDVATDEVNRSASCEKIFGPDSDDLCNATSDVFFQRVHPDDQTRLATLIGNLTPSADTYNTDYRIVFSDGRVVTLEETGQGFFDAAGQMIRVIGAATDITERKQAESNQKVTTELLRILNRGSGDLSATIRETLQLIKESYDFDAVGLRLRDGDDYPYYEQSGFSDEFLREETFLCEKRGDGSLIRKEDGSVTLECTCGLVLSERTDPSLPFFTEVGSFWTNESNELLAIPIEEDPRDNARNRCIHAGYQSVGLIPVRAGDDVIGLLQLNGRREGMFSRETIRFFESLGENIGSALRRRQAEESLSQARAEAERHAAELRSFFSSIVDGVVLYDADDNVILANEATRQILGTDLRTVEERIENYNLCKLDGTPLMPEETASRRALQGETVKELRYKLTVPGGKNKVLAVNASPVRAADGSMLGVAAVFRDITDQMEFEQRKEALFDREHHIAEVLQQAIVPPMVPSEMLGYRFAVRYRPAMREAEIGGDFYDVFDLGDNRIAVLIGDVAGKGLTAALRVASARHAIRSYAFVDPRPARVLTLANEALCRDTGDASQILTAFYAVLDPDLGGMTYASAGHEPPIVRCISAGCEELEIGGMPLGLMPGISYEQSRRRLESGDILVAVTDGITEARAPGCVLFGKERLVELVDQLRREPLEDIAAGIMAAATAHAEGELQDDAAVVVFSPRADGA